MKYTSLIWGRDIKNPLIIYLTNTYDQEKLIACTSGGVIIHNIKNNSNRYIKGTNEKPLMGFVLGATSDRLNNIWFSSKYGIYRYCRAADSIDIYFSKKSNNLHFNSIVTIYCDSYDNIWAGCDQGLLLFDRRDFAALIFSMFLDSATRFCLVVTIATVGLSLQSVHTRQLSDAKLK